MPNLNLNALGKNSPANNQTASINLLQKNLFIFLVGFVCLSVNCRFQADETSYIKSKTNNLETNIPTTPTVTPQNNKNAELNNAGNKSNNISCNDEELSPIWKILSDDKDVKELIIESDLGGDCSDYVSITKKVDLNDDGINELFVEGNGNFGNVSTFPIWVVGKDGNDFKIFLREQGEEYEIKQTRTNGYNDLFFPSRRSVQSSYLRTYKFNDGKYQVQKCQVAFYDKSDKPSKVFNCDETKKIEKFESEFELDN